MVAGMCCSQGWLLMGQACVWMCGEAGVATLKNILRLLQRSQYRSHPASLPEGRSRESPERETDCCKGNLYLCLGKVNHKCVGLSLPWVYSHICTWVRTWWGDFCSSGQSFLGQEIDHTPATLPSWDIPFSSLSKTLWFVWLRPWLIPPTWRLLDLKVTRCLFVLVPDLSSKRSVCISDALKLVFMQRPLSTVLTLDKFVNVIFFFNEAAGN